MKTIFRKLSVVIVASLFLVACGSSDGGTEKRTLTIYGAVMQDYMIKAVDEFEKETGIEVDAVRMSAGEIYGRVEAEKENPQASVWFGGPADSFVSAKEAGLLEPYISPNAADIEDQFKDPEGYWTGIYLGYLGFASNQELLDEMGVDAPESWEDLLKPEFKDQIVSANPGSSGTAYTNLATIIQLMGEEEGLEYMAKLDPQIRQYTKSGAAPARMAGQGEAIVGITFLHDAIKYKEEGMKDLVITAPKEGTGYEIGATGLIKGGPNQEEAKLFIDFLLSKEAQEMAQTVGSYTFLTNKNATNPVEAQSIENTKLIDYDFVWAGEKRAEFVEKWNQRVKAGSKIEE